MLPIAALHDSWRPAPLLRAVSALGVAVVLLDLLLGGQVALVCQRVFDRFAQVVRGLVAAAFVALLLPEGRSPLVAAVGRAHPRAPGPQPPQSVARVHGGGHACERGPPAGAPRLAWLPEGCAPPRARVAGMVRPAIRRTAQPAARPTSSCDPDRAKRILLLPQRTPSHRKPP